jgi:hypothetical protein
VEATSSTPLPFLIHKAMAKKVTPEEELDTTENNTPSQDTNEVKVPKKKEDAQTVIPPGVDEILKSFRSYETLYVDTHGGVFTSDTPENIRGKAILYKNPHYKSQTHS